MATLFEAYVTNAGKYSEGQLVGETLKFPTTAHEVEALLKRIGVDGVRYQEIFITSFDGDVLGLYDHLSEYENLDELNHLACLLSELTSSELETLEAVLDSGDHCSSVRDIINLTQNLDCYGFYPGVSDEETLGRIYVDDLEMLDVPDQVKPYFDYEAYRKTAVFFIISDTTQTYNFLVALAFSQMFNLLCERADNVHGGRLPHHVRVLWDEAANTGQVPQLEKLVAVIRSREVSLCLLYQQLAQCKAIYDKHAETILGNMDSVVFLGGREASTIKEISENWLGKATISMQTDSRSRGQSESYSQNTQRLGRELMTPAELATMPGDKCILQLRGLPPFFSPKYDLKRHPNYRYTAEADKQKNAFDLDRLINRRRRPGLNEACTMYEVTVPDDALTEEDEDILNYDDIDDPDAFA